LMIGRGSLINPFIFHQIRSHFSKKDYKVSIDDLCQYICEHQKQLPKNMSEKIKIGKMKQLMSYVFQGSEELKSKRQSMLRKRAADLDAFMQFALLLLKG